MNPTRDLREQERWALGMGGLALALGGWRSGVLTGRLLGGLGGVLAVRAWLGRNDLHAFRCLIDWTCAGKVADVVDHASSDSFPASDSPSWTPTAGSRPVVTNRSKFGVRGSRF